MRSLTRGLRAGHVEGRPLPTVLPSLARAGGHFNRGELTLMAGQSGAGKSAIAQFHAITWATRDNLIGLYFSADGRQLAVASRFAAMLTGVATKDAKKRLMDGDRELIDLIAKTNGVEWCFAGDIQLDLLDLELSAFEEKWGRYPDFIVVDNLMDMEEEHEDEYRSLRQVTKRLNQIAGDLDIAAIGLHHTSENEKEDPCPPKKALFGKISQKATVIMTTSAEMDNGRKPIAVVKSREEKVDKSGRTAQWIKCNPESFTFEDY